MKFSAETRAGAAGSAIVPLFLAVFVLFLATLRLERSGREIKNGSRKDAKAQRFKKQTNRFSWRALRLERSEREDEE